MPAYAVPRVAEHPKLKPNTIQLVASGDLRLSANQVCWPAQKAMEEALVAAIKQAGFHVKRIHAYDAKKEHGFIDSQKMGLEVFRKVDPDAPLIVAQAVWQYSHHVLSGLMRHRGPILTVANWSGQWPGLVGLLNLNGSLTKANVKYSSLWSEDFQDAWFQSKLEAWLSKGEVKHSQTHVTPFRKVSVPAGEQRLGQTLAAQLQSQRAIMGVFDEGCMGMFNAIIPDSLLNPTGVFKERLSQSALYHETMQTEDREADAVRKWFETVGLTFHTGKNHATQLTDKQIRLQCKMYIAALRIADDFGCDCIGIQYQQGLKDLLPASDLVEGTLNNVARPPVSSRDGLRVLYKGQPLPHFNEVDECAGLDALMTFRLHSAMKQPVENTLHDLRWADWDATQTVSDYVWVLLISGAAPPAHFINGWKGATSVRQPEMYFPSGGGTLRGISKPGEIVWSRVFIENNRLKMDVGRAKVVALPEIETQRRWDATTVQWPIMHTVFYGIDRNQMMARHKSNHIQVVYANSVADADSSLLAKAAMADAMGMEVALCGTRSDGTKWS
jgi:hypothetical protein